MSKRKGRGCVPLAFEKLENTYQDCVALLKKDEKMSFEGQKNFLMDKTGLGNNDLDVFWIDYQELKKDDKERAKELSKLAQERLKQFEPTYQEKEDFDVIDKLASLRKKDDYE